VPATPPGLRKLALAVAVLYDVDLLPHDSGLLLTGAADVEVEWPVVAAVIEEVQGPDGRGASERSEMAALARWLIARRELAVGAKLCVRGVPVQHTDHPGLRWIREVIAGDALSLGFGYGPESLPLPAGVIEHTGRDVATAWSQVRLELEKLGELAALRDKRHSQEAIRPLGGADVVTLLGARTLRRELAAGEGDGLAALIVPLRTRGWRARTISDPAYGPALAAAMPAEDRGFERPLLVTADEISEVRAGGDPMRLLRDDTHTS
jgi:hypothetical protein